MITLGLIADKNEVKPPKKSRSKKPAENGVEESGEGISGEDSMSDSDSGSDGEDDGPAVRQQKQPKPTRPKPVKQSNPVAAQKKRAPPNKTTLNAKSVCGILSEVEESMKEAIDWLVESFTEACDDYDPSLEDPDDGVPLVAVMQSHQEALKNVQFGRLLRELGVAEPVDNVSDKFVFNI